MNGFIKIDRSISQWEWYTDIKTFKLFFHLLISANFKDAKFRGITIKRGQLIRTINTLSRETGLTCNEVRTTLKHLKQTGDITYESHTQYTLFTVLNYESYQTDSQTFNEQSTNTSQQMKKNKNDNNKYNSMRAQNSTFDENEFFRIAVEHAKKTS